MAVQGPPFPEEGQTAVPPPVSTAKCITGYNHRAPGEAAYQEGKGRNEEGIKQLTGGVIFS